MKEIYVLVCGGIFYGYLCAIGKALFRLFGEFGGKNAPANFFEPVLGLAFLTIVSTYVSFASIPFSKASLPLGVFISVSAFLILCRKLNNEKRLVYDKDRGPKIEWALLITALFLSMPFLLGGYEFSVLRGNGTDSFNYVTVADALLNYPLNWINSQNEKSLALISPTLPLASELLQTRFSTSALLAFVSALFRMAPIEFEYVFTLVLSVLLVNAITGFMAISGFKKWYVPWIASISTIGFWGQFILDLRAFSHITAAPILMAILGFVLAPQESNQKIFSTSMVIISMLLSALWFQYPEICVPFFPLLTVILFERSAIFLQINNNFKYLLKYFIRTLALVLLIISPSLGLYIKYIKAQGHFAINSSLGWEKAYFSWLHNPFLGFWGMGSKLGIGGTVDNLFLLIGILGSVILTILVFWSCIQLWLSNKYEQKQKRNIQLERYLILAYFLCASEYYFLFLMNNPWSAGKVLSYYSFIVPCFVILWLSLASSIARKNKNIIQKYIATAGISFWVVWNIMFGGTRIFHSVNKCDFQNYISGHGEYRRVNARQLDSMPRVNLPEPSVVCVFEPSVWGREFLTHFVEGLGYSAKTPGFSRIRSPELNENILFQTRSYALVNPNYYDQIPRLQSEHGQSEFIVRNLDGRFAVLLEFKGGYGLEMNQENSNQFIWTGSQDVEVFVVTNKTGCTVSMKILPANERNTKDPITIFAEVNNEKAIEQKITGEITLDIKLQPSEGPKIQKIRISNMDARSYPTKIGLDHRDLRLYFQVIKIKAFD